MIATLSLFVSVTSGLPAFYRALLRAWTAPDSSLYQAGLIVCTANTTLLRTDPLTCKSCYQLLLSLNPAHPNCVVKFRSNYDDLDWDSTWKTLFLMPLDKKPIDLCWKGAHGVLYTAHRLVSLGLNVPPDVSVVTLMRLWSICSSTVPWPKVVWIGFSHDFFSPLL